MTEIKRVPSTAHLRINKAYAIACDHAKNAVVAFLELGSMLNEVKASLPHGEFTPWIEEHCDFTPQHARRYIAAFKKADGKYIIDEWVDVPRLEADGITTLKQLQPPSQTKTQTKTNLDVRFEEPASDIDETIDAEFEVVGEEESECLVDRLSELLSDFDEKQVIDALGQYIGWNFDDEGMDRINDLTIAYHIQRESFYRDRDKQAATEAASSFLASDEAAFKGLRSRDWNGWFDRK